MFADALVTPAHPLREKLAAFIERRPTLPSRLLADFYFFFRSDNNQPIPLRHIGILYGSQLSGETESRRLHMELEAGDPEPDSWEDTHPNIEFQWVDPTADDVEAAQLGTVAAPLTVGADDRLTFWSGLKEASITLPSTVRLVSHRPEFVIGPEVQIAAKRLEIPSAESLVVKGTVARPWSQCGAAAGRPWGVDCGCRVHAKNHVLRDARR